MATRKAKTPKATIEPGRVREALERSVTAAKHLDLNLDAAAIEGLRALADKIDAWDTIVKWAIEDANQSERYRRPAVPQNDNVSIAAFLKNLDALGLTPASRGALNMAEEVPSIAPESTTPDDTPFDPATV